MSVQQSEVARSDGLTDAEGRVADLLVEACKAWGTLRRGHPSDDPEFMDAIRRCQDLLQIRIVRRLYPAAWPRKCHCGNMLGPDDRCVRGHYAEGID